MQVLAHLTELMKYDTKPSQGTTTSTPLYDYPTTSTSTIRPTVPHRPGIYAPPRPLGPEFYFANQRCKKNFLLYHLNIRLCHKLVS